MIEKVCSLAYNAPGIFFTIGIAWLILGGIANACFDQRIGAHTRIALIVIAPLAIVILTFVGLAPAIGLITGSKKR